MCIITSFIQCDKTGSKLKWLNKLNRYLYDVHGHGHGHDPSKMIILWSMVAIHCFNISIWLYYPI